MEEGFFLLEELGEVSAIELRHGSSKKLSRFLFGTSLEVSEYQPHD